MRNLGASLRFFLKGKSAKSGFAGLRHCPAGQCAFGPLQSLAHRGILQAAKSRADLLPRMVLLRKTMRRHGPRPHLPRNFPRNFAAEPLNQRNTNKNTKKEKNKFPISAPFVRFRVFRGKFPITARPPTEHHNHNSMDDRIP
jgi:hypothetical protein